MDALGEHGIVAVIEIGPDAAPKDALAEQFQLRSRRPDVEVDPRVSGRSVEYGRAGQVSDA